MENQTEVTDSMKQNQEISKSQADVEVPTMYNCFLEVDEFDGKSNFKFFLVNSPWDRKRQLPYHKMIVNYEKLLGKMEYVEAVIDEMFLLDEVKELQEHLSDYQNVRLSYTEATLPIEGDELIPMYYKKGVIERNLYDIVEYNEGKTLGYELFMLFDSN